MAEVLLPGRGPRIGPRRPVRRSPRNSAGKPTGFYNERFLASRRNSVVSPPESTRSRRAHGDGTGQRRSGGETDMVEPEPWPTLPFTQSYVGLLQAPESPQRPPRQRWPTPAETITWPNDPNVPAGWHCEEVDLDPDDLDAQLIRVEERIANKILPDWFVDKKKDLLKRKAEQDAMIQSEEAFPGLSLDVIKRLDDLKGMEADLRARGKDPSGLGPNIAALINAYRTRQLDWHPGLVTYWSNGIQICQPRPFHYQEFLQVNQLYNGHASFWVEGLFSQGPKPQFTLKYQELKAGGNYWLRDMYLTVRLPNNHGTQMQFRFLDDTGASTMSMYDVDIMRLQSTGGGGWSQPPPLLGAERIRGFEGGEGSLFEIRALEVNMAADGTGEMMTRWDWVPVVLHDTVSQRGPPPERLSGPWPRYKLYMGSAPDGAGRGWAFDQKGGWGAIVPTVHNIGTAPRPAEDPRWNPAQAARIFQRAGKQPPHPGAPFTTLSAGPSAGAPRGPAKNPPPLIPVAPNLTRSDPVPPQQPAPAPKVGAPGSLFWPGG